LLRRVLGSSERSRQVSFEALSLVGKGCLYGGAQGTVVLLLFNQGAAKSCSRQSTETTLTLINQPRFGGVFVLPRSASAHGFRVLHHSTLKTMADTTITEASLRAALTERLKATYVEIQDMSGTTRHPTTSALTSSTQPRDAHFACSHIVAQHS